VTTDATFAAFCARVRPQLVGALRCTAGIAAWPTRDASMFVKRCVTAVRLL
jgi:hypothetical protein